MLGNENQREYLFLVFYNVLFYSPECYGLLDRSILLVPPPKAETHDAFNVSYITLLFLYSLSTASQGSQSFSHPWRGLNALSILKR